MAAFPLKNPLPPFPSPPALLATFSPALADWIPTLRRPPAGQTVLTGTPWGGPDEPHQRLQNRPGSGGGDPRSDIGRS